ncbi:MAG TPA: HepT-like ribonuclease domain-containing protein [Stellaceae bacterium]|nr:HepT-like ribonuclease domain-containing protein [Stellaceae bacterium]
MPRSILLRLADIQEAIKGIVGLTANGSYDSFARDWAMQRAVERALEIISEASRHIPDEYKTLAPHIPWRQIAAIGNLLRHEYQRTDSSAVWNIVVEHVPSLERAVDRLIAAANEREPP